MSSYGPSFLTRDLLLIPLQEFCNCIYEGLPGLFTRDDFVIAAEQLHKTSASYPRGNQTSLLRRYHSFVARVQNQSRASDLGEKIHDVDLWKFRHHARRILWR